MRDEPMDALIRIAIAALRPPSLNLRERGWDANTEVADLGDHRYRVSLHIDLPRKGVPIEMTEPSQSPDQEDTMPNAHIDAEGPVEIGAYLREHGWRQVNELDARPDDPRLWTHPSLPALPPLSMTAAWEIAKAAAADELVRGNPAGPSRVH